MKTVVCVTRNFPSPLKYWRGTFVENFCIALKEQGVELSVILPEKFWLIIKESILFSIGRCKFRNSQVEWKYAPFISPSRFVYLVSKAGYGCFIAERPVCRALKQESARKQFDCVYAHFIYNGFAALNWCRNANIPLVVVSGESDFAKFYNRADKIYFLAQVEKFNHLFFVSEKNSNEFRKYFGHDPGCNHSVLPNAVDIERFAPRNDRDALRLELGISQNEKIALFLGHLIPRKGPLRVKAAIDLLDGVKGVYIGVGPDKPLGERVIYLGALENSEVSKWLAAADVFVLPSLNEGRANAIIEALASGLPVVVSDRPFNREFITEDCAVFVNPDSPEDIARGISEILENDDRREAMSKAARKLAEEFSLEKRAKTFIETIQALR